jgi:hypothetical protein
MASTLCSSAAPLPRPVYNYFKVYRDWFLFPDFLISFSFNLGVFECTTSNNYLAKNILVELAN